MTSTYKKQIFIIWIAMKNSLMSWKENLYKSIRKDNSQEKWGWLNIMDWNHVFVSSLFLILTKAWGIKIYIHKPIRTRRTDEEKMAKKF